MFMKSVPSAREAVEAVLLEHEDDAVEEVAADALPVEVGLRAPGGVDDGGIEVELGAVVVPEEVVGRAEVVPDDVEEDGDAAEVELVDHVLEVVGRAEPPLRGVHGERVVAAGEVAGELVDGVDHDAVDAEVGEVVGAVADIAVGGEGCRSRRRGRCARRSCRHGAGR
jgi:hypothetical protein